MILSVCFWKIQLHSNSSHQAQGTNEGGILGVWYIDLPSTCPFKSGSFLPKSNPTHQPTHPVVSSHIIYLLKLKHLGAHFTRSSFMIAPPPNFKCTFSLTVFFTFLFSKRCRTTSWKKTHSSFSSKDMFLSVPLYPIIYTCGY